MSGTSFTPNTLVMVRKYFYAGGQRIAMRENGTLVYLFGDHLGSTSLVANRDGTTKAQQLYKAFGEKRFPSGASTLPTTFRFTGQRESSTGLYYYRARYYDPLIGRFVQADSIVPNAFDPASFDRYAYVRNSPVNFVDPSGNLPISDEACGTQPWLPGCDRSYSYQLSVTVDNLYLQQQGKVVGEIKAQYVRLPGEGDKPFFNLCGQLTLASILEYFLEETKDAWLPRLVGTYKGPTGHGELGFIVQNLDLPGTLTYSYYAAGSAYHYVSGCKVVTYEKRDHRFGDTLSQYYGMIHNWFKSGAMIQVSCWIDKDTGWLAKWGTGNGARHWAIITGVSTVGVTIWNPYTYKSQYYSWDNFYLFTTVHVYTEDGMEIIYHDAGVYTYLPDPPGSY